MTPETITMSRADAEKVAYVLGRYVMATETALIDEALSIINSALGVTK